MGITVSVGVEPKFGEIWRNSLTSQQSVIKGLQAMIGRSGKFNARSYSKGVGFGRAGELFGGNENLGEEERLFVLEDVVISYRPYPNAAVEPVLVLRRPNQRLDWGIRVSDLEGPIEWEED